MKNKEMTRQREEKSSEARATSNPRKSPKTNKTHPGYDIAALLRSQKPRGKFFITITQREAADENPPGLSAEAISSGAEAGSGNPTRTILLANEAGVIFVASSGIQARESAAVLR